MNDIKFGLKLWSTNVKSINAAAGLVKDGVFDYIELQVVPGTEILPFQNIPAAFILHATSDEKIFNMALRGKEAANVNVVKECLAWAVRLKAKYIILHPGCGDVSAVKDFLLNFDDKRILIENMPRLGLHGEAMVGYSVSQIRELTRDRFGFCLDLGHAIKAAASAGEEYRTRIGEFIKMGPSMVHIADGHFNDQKDEHLNIKEGNYDFDFLVDGIKQSRARFVTLETPRTDYDSLADDLTNLAKLRSFFVKE